MIELTEKELDAIHDTHDKVIKIDTLLGNGEKGLCYEVRCHNKRIGRIEIVIGGLIASGVITGGGVAIAKLLGG